METINLQPHSALCIPELRKIILSFCSDNASAYYVCIDWFYALDEVLTAGDSSCLSHIGGVLSRQRGGVRVVHLAEILAATE